MVHKVSRSVIGHNGLPPLKVYKQAHVVSHLQRTLIYHTYMQYIASIHLKQPRLMKARSRVVLKKRKAT